MGGKRQGRAASRRHRVAAALSRWRPVLGCDVDKDTGRWFFGLIVLGVSDGRKFVAWVAVSRAVAVKRGEAVIVASPALFGLFVACGGSTMALDSVDRITKSSLFLQRRLVRWAVATVFHLVRAALSF